MTIKSPLQIKIIYHLRPDHVQIILIALRNCIINKTLLSVLRSLYCSDLIKLSFEWKRKHSRPTAEYHYYLYAFLRNALDYPENRGRCLTTARKKRMTFSAVTIDS